MVKMRLYDNALPISVAFWSQLMTIDDQPTRSNHVSPPPQVFVLHYLGRPSGLQIAAIYFCTAMAPWMTLTMPLANLWFLK
jgi:hypothetical protein